MACLRIFCVRICAGEHQKDDSRLILAMCCGKISGAEIIGFDSRLVTPQARLSLPLLGVVAGAIIGI